MGRGPSWHAGSIAVPWLGREGAYPHEAIDELIQHIHREYKTSHPG